MVIAAGVLSCSNPDGDLVIVDHPIGDSLPSPTVTYALLDSSNSTPAPFVSEPLAFNESPALLADALGVAGSEAIVALGRMTGAVRLWLPTVSTVITHIHGAIALAARDTSVLVFTAYGDVVEFAFVRESGMLTEIGARRTNVVARDVCVIGNMLFIHGFVDGQAAVIHEVAWNGDVVRSFALPYRVSGTFVQQKLNRGSVACVESPGVIALALMNLPVVVGYGTDGAVKWVSYAPEFHQGMLRQRGTSRITSGPLTDSVSIGLAVVPTAGRVIYQMMTYSRLDLEYRRPGRLRTYVVDPESGRFNRAVGIDGPVVGPVGEGLLGSSSSAGIEAVIYRAVGTGVSTPSKTFEGTLGDRRH